MSQDITDHEDLGTVVTWERDSKPSVRGVVTGVQRQHGNWWNAKTNSKVASVSIRYRLKPEGERARWTGWFPDRTQPIEAEAR